MRSLSQIPTRLKVWPVAFFLFLAFIKAASVAAETTAPDETTQKHILATLNQNSQFLRTFKASLEIGLPHPTQPLVQWCHGLIGFQREGDFLYLKGYHALVPLYFLLKSFDQKFWLYLPRVYTVYWGENAVLERDPDIDLRLIAGDILEAVAPTKINSSDQIEWRTNGTGYHVILTEQHGGGRREIDFDQALNVRKVTQFNSAGFRSLEITKNDWRVVGHCRTERGQSPKKRTGSGQIVEPVRFFGDCPLSVRLPYEIIMKRFVPRPNDLIMRFKEIRPNARLEATILDHQFPSDATYIELIQQE